jgi:hypothetical protein
MKKTSVSAIVVVVAMMVTSLLLFYENIEAAPSSGAKLYVYPAKIEDPLLVPGSTFWVNITVYNVTSMHICEFNLSFTPTILGINAFLSLPVKGQYPLTDINGNGAKGFIYAKLTYATPITLPTTQAAMLTIKFTAKNYGFTLLHLHNSTLTDSNGYAIPHEVQDGSVRIIKHDVAVAGASPSVNETYVGRTIDIEVNVKNEGNIAENFTVSVFADGTLIGTSDVNNLATNETRQLMFSWNTTDYAPSMTLYTINAQASVVPYEKNTANNVYIDGQVKIKIIGDVNGDGVVNIDDLNLWSAAYNSKKGDSNWNPQADINGNGLVDEEDGILIIQHYKDHI